jgi:hypothetical protein
MPECDGICERSATKRLGVLAVARFLFWKNGEKGGLRLRAQTAAAPKFLGEFFFPKTSSLLRKRCSRRTQRR